MLFSLIHTENGSSSQYNLFPFEVYRLIQSLFGYHYLTFGHWRVVFFRPKQSPLTGDCFA
jgi:hypothetical protein